MAGVRQAKADVEPLVLFNRMLAKRWAACADYLPPRIRQGTLGHGTLSADLSPEAGRLIRAGAESGDMVQVVMSVEALFNVPADLAAQIPVLAKGQTETTALLSISIERAAVRVDMSWMVDTGATPSPETAELYEPTSHVFWIAMAPWQAQVLTGRALKLGDRWPKFLKDLVGDATHHPKTDVLGGGGPCLATLNALRQTLCAIALDHGVPRMTAALALAS